MAPGKVQAAAIYCRISKDDAGRGAGVKRQEADGRAYAQGKGWLVAEVYVDNDASGWTGRPPHFDRMLADLAAGSRDAVVIYNVDRLTRQPFLFEEFLKVCEQQHVTRLGSVGGDIDLATSDGQFMARVLVAQAKKSSDDTSRRIRRAFDEKAANGQWKHGGLRPFGYEWDESAGTILPVRAEAALIREAAKRVLAGDSRRAITVDWHRKGLLTSEGKPWSITRLANLLRSPRIAGLRVHRGEVVGKGDWPPILDMATFERVGKALRRTGKTHAGRQRSLLGGLVVCGRCGSKLTHKSRTSGGTKIRTYACASDSAEKCGRLRVLADPVERIAADTAFANFDFGRVGPQPDASGDAEVQMAQERLQELAEAEADITDERVKGSLTGNAFLRAIRAISDERTALEGELRSLERKSQPLWSLGDTQVFIGPPDTVSRLSPDEMEWWRTLVGAVFEQIIIDPAGKGRRFRPERVRLVPNRGFKAAKRRVLREVPTQAGVWKKVTYD